MKKLLKSPFKRATLVCSVENINPKKGILSTMFTTTEGKHFTCLCLPGRMIQTQYPSEHAALKRMEEYRQLYGEIKNNGRQL